MLETFILFECCCSCVWENKGGGTLLRPFSHRDLPSSPLKEKRIPNIFPWPFYSVGYMKKYRNKNLVLTLDRWNPFCKNGRFNLVSRLLLTYEFLLILQDFRPTTDAPLWTSNFRKSSHAFKTSVGSFLFISDLKICVTFHSAILLWKPDPLKHFGFLIDTLSATLDNLSPIHSF